MRLVPLLGGKESEWDRIVRGDGREGRMSGEVFSFERLLGFILLRLYMFLCVCAWEYH